MVKLVRSKIKYSHLHRQASALVLALVIIIILFMTGTGLLALGYHSQAQTLRTSKEIEARCAADAGLVKALYEMNEKLKIVPWDDNNLPSTTNESLANSNATLSYTVSKVSEGVYTITAVGVSGQTQREVTSTLRLKGLTDYGLLTKGQAKWGNNSLLDWYDSGNPMATGLEIILGTLGTLSQDIWLGNNIDVNGNIFVGVGGDPDVVVDTGSNTIVTGQQYALTDPIQLPDITAPALEDKQMNIDVGSNTTVSIDPTDTGKYVDINVGNNSTLEISGGEVVLHVTGNISLQNNTMLSITSDSSLKLYLDGNMDVSNNSGINNQTQVPANFALYGTGTSGQSIDLLKNNGDLYGVIYAPNADVQTNSNSNLYGSITAATFDGGNNSTFYYDWALRNGKVTDEQVTFVVDRWSE